MNRFAAIAAALVLMAPLAAARADAPPKETVVRVAVGTLGPYDIAIDLTEKDYVQITAAHYFYASKLQDIPLTPGMEGATLVLREPGGGVFRLRTVGEGLRPMKTFDLWRSLGFAGTWTKGGKTLPVKLGGGYGGRAGERWYSQVTDESDAAFEGRVRRLLHGVLAGDRAAAAREVDYPMHVNRKTGKTLMIRSRRELLAQWDQVFTPRLVSRLRRAIAHEMFVHEGEAMLLDGDLWFSAKGLTGVNQL